MAIPDLLIGSVFSGGNVQVGELVGGTTFNQIGSDLTATSGHTLASDNSSGVTNCVIEYRGAIYCWYPSGNIQHRIDRYDRGTGMWTNQVAANNSSTDFPATGFYIANTGSLQRLFIGTRRGDTDAVTIRYTDDGTTWNGTSSVGTATIGRDLDTCVWTMFNNKLYGVADGSTTSTWVEIDPVALTLTSGSAPWFGATTATNGTLIDFCTFDDRLFALALDARYSQSADWALYEFTGSGWSLNTTITTGSGAGGDGVDNDSVQEGQPCLFKQPGQDKLIAIFSTTGTFNTNSGTQMYELTQSGSTFTPNEVTNVVIPANLRPGARGSSADAAQDRWYAYSSNDDPSSLDEVYLFTTAGPAPGTSYSVYTFTDTSTLLASPAAGPSITFSIPSQKAGGGDRINKGSGNQCIVESAVAVLGGFQISYRVYGTQSSQNVTGYYSQPQETPSQTQMTFSAQTGGTGITGGNTVTGITGDDGSTLFTVTWDTVTDGIPNGDAVHIILDINP